MKKSTVKGMFTVACFSSGCGCVVLGMPFAGVLFGVLTGIYAMDTVHHRVEEIYGDHDE